MRFENYIKEDEILNEGALFQKLLKQIGNKSTSVLKKLFRSNWIKLMTNIRQQGLEKDALSIINRHLKTNFNSLDKIEKETIKENYSTNEDFKHYWDLVKAEAFPTLAFYPALSVWLEIDKLLKSTGDPSYTAMLAYGVFWVFLVSGKHIAGWLNWKKQNPEEHETEGGKKNPFSV